MLSDTTGYFRIRSFNSLTFEQFKSAYAALESQGAVPFIYDVRGASGGSLEAARSVVEYLLPRGVYAYSISHKDGGETPLKAEDTFETDKNSATLVNSQTSGMGEFFAAFYRSGEKPLWWGPKRRER